MDHQFHHRLDPAELNDINLHGATVYDQDNKTVGTISHIHGVGADTIAIVDVGGFLGIGAKPVALPLTALDVMRDDEGTVHAITRMTRAAIDALPEHSH